ncbi:MAG: M4 family metallopeptidase [Bacteroidetes bacterium]|nr:M4 family metallopeptidase [Bacteroidota bacterium]
MVRTIIHNAIGLSLVAVILSPAHAQERMHKDPRTLKGLEVSKIPTISNLKQYIDQRRGSKKLREAADIITTVPKEIVAPIASGTIDPVPSQHHTPIEVWRMARAANGTANWMWHARTKTSAPTTQSISKPSAISVLQNVKEYLRLDDPATELRQIGDTRDELGQEHVRFAQYYNSVPVWNRDIYVHFDAQGEATIINGTYEPTPRGVNTVPGLRAEAAEVLAIADLQAKGEWASVSGNSSVLASSSYPTATLVLFPVEGRAPRLAYEVSVVANILQSYYYIIDATTGEIIERFDHFCSLLPEHATPPRVTFPSLALSSNRPLSMPEGSFTDASGTDLNGVTRNFRTYHHDDGNYYMIWDLPSLNVGASKLPDQPSGGALTLNLRSADYAQNATIYHNVTSNNSWQDATAVSAHYNTSVAYNYYHSTFSRNAIDDKNGVINSIIHVTSNGEGMDNAYWNGGDKIMVYGDGKNEFKPLAGGLDVAGHEMTHGVTENSANLVYQYQSGALNESMSDVFGVMIDPSNLTVGEQVMLASTGKTCLRDLANPHSAQALSDQPATMSEFQQLDLNSDNGGVHINSGIPNHAAAIIIQAIGRDKSQKIYYRALTKYLTRDAQFLDARRSLVSAATDLFGASGTEVNAVKNAFDQVQIFDNGGGGGGTDDKLQPQTGGSNYIAFETTSGQIGFVDVASGNASLFNSAAAVARVSDGGASRSVLTTPRDGKTIWFIDPNGHLCFTDSVGTVHSFSTVHIQSDGDLWNVAVAPDESVVALSSAYAKDPNIYIFDGSVVSRFPLEIAADNTTVSAIDYPDVISWSPNAKYPKLSFDCFSEAQVNGSTYGYWSIYEMLFGTGAYTITNLVPSQPYGYDIGNISYSSTNPGFVAFNSIDPLGDEDVVIADFDNNQIGSLNLPTTATIGGNAVVDGDRPTFSPDDAFLTWSSAENNSLMFLNSNSQITFLQYPFALHKPYWFLYGGSADVKQQSVSQFALRSTPSVIEREATITWTQKTAGVASVDLVNVFGVSVRSIASQLFGEGANAVRFDRSNLAAGTYFVRVRAAEGQEVFKVILE